MCNHCATKDEIATAWHENCLFLIHEKNRIQRRLESLERIATRIASNLRSLVESGHVNELMLQDLRRALDD